MSCVARSFVALRTLDRPPPPSKKKKEKKKKNTHQKDKEKKKKKKKERRSETSVDRSEKKEALKMNCGTVEREREEDQPEDFFYSVT